MATIVVTTNGFDVVASTSNNYVVFGNGILTVDAGVTVSGFINVGDGGEVQIIGTSLNSDVNFLGTEAIDGGTATNVDVNGGLLLPEAGDTVGTYVTNGGLELLEGDDPADLFNTTVGSGGTQTIIAGSLVQVDESIISKRRPSIRERRPRWLPLQFNSVASRLSAH